MVEGARRQEPVNYGTGDKHVETPEEIAAKAFSTKGYKRPTGVKIEKANSDATANQERVQKEAIERKKAAQDEAERLQVLEASANAEPTDETANVFNIEALSKQKATEKMLSDVEKAKAAGAEREKAAEAEAAAKAKRREKNTVVLDVSKGLFRND